MTDAAAISPPSRRRPAGGKIALGALVLAALAAAWRWTPLAEFLTAERVMAWARVVQETAWAPFALALAYTPAALVLVPRPVITVLLVIAFGPWLGIAYAVAGILIAALVTYYIGRALPRGTLRKVAGDKAEAVGKGARRHGVLSVLAFNLLPVPPFAVQNMIAGAAGIKVWEYAAGTLLSLIPALVAAAVLGDQIVAMLDDSAEVSWWAVGGMLAVFFAVTFFARRWAVKYAG